MAAPDPWARGADPWAAAASSAPAAKAAAAPAPAARAAPVPAARAEPPRPQAGDDPWEAGDPWAAAAKAKAKAPAPRQEPQPQPWANFHKTGASAAGGKDREKGKESKAPGKGSEKGPQTGGKAGGGKNAGRVKQTRKLGDWHAHIVEEEPDQWNNHGGSSSSSGIGRGKALIQPSWKTATGLAAQDRPPSLAEDAVSPPPLEQQLRPADWQIAQANHRGTWLQREAASTQTFASFEVEVKEPFDVNWMGCWLACPTKGEVLLVLSSRGEDLIYVMAHCRQEQPCGWVPLVHVQPLGGTGVHDFLVRLSTEDVKSLPRIGLGVAKAEGAITGLVVVDVQPGSLVEMWNMRCVHTFGRNQLLIGDIITWVNNCSEPEDMKRALRSVPSNGYPLRARVVRCALSLPCQAEELREIVHARSFAVAGGSRGSMAGFGGCRAWEAAEVHVAAVPMAPSATGVGAGPEADDEDGAADPFDGMDGQDADLARLAAGLAMASQDSPWHDMAEAGKLAGPDVWATNGFTPNTAPPGTAPGAWHQAPAADSSMRAAAPEFVPAGQGDTAVAATQALGPVGAPGQPSEAAAPGGGRREVGAAGGAVDPWQICDPWGGVAGRRPDGKSPGAAPAAPSSGTEPERAAAPAGPAAAVAQDPPAASEAAGAPAADGSASVGRARAEPPSDDRASEPTAGADGPAEAGDQEYDDFQ